MLNPNLNQQLFNSVWIMMGWIHQRRRQLWSKSQLAATVSCNTVHLSKNNRGLRDQTTWV